MKFYDTPITVQIEFVLLYTSQHFYCFHQNSPNIYGCVNKSPILLLSSKLPTIFVKRLKLFIFVAEIVQTNNTLEIDLNKVGPAQFQSMPKYRLQEWSSFTKYCFAP